LRPRTPRPFAQDPVDGPGVFAQLRVACLDRPQRRHDAVGHGLLEFAVRREQRRQRARVVLDTPGQDLQQVGHPRLADRIVTDLATRIGDRAHDLPSQHLRWVEQVEHARVVVVRLAHLGGRV